MIRTGRSLAWSAAALLLLAALTSVHASAADEARLCPEGCHCSSQDAVFSARCASLSFMKKLSPKQFASILSLDVSNASISTLDKMLVRKLVNLERLNLSHNRLSNIKHFPHLPKLTHLNLRSNLIKSIAGKQLPVQLEVLDLSQNYVRELPADLLDLQHLKRIYVGGNVFSCSRESLDVRDALLDRKIKFVGRPYCSNPPKFQGKSWLHADDLGEYLKLQNEEEMQADDAAGSGDTGTEGSGEGSLFDNQHRLSTVAPADERGIGEDSDFVFEGEQGSGGEEISTTLEPFIVDEDDEDHEHDEGSGSVPPVPLGDDRDKDDEKYHQVTDSFTSAAPIEPDVVTKRTAYVEAAPRPTEAPPDSHVEASKTNKGSIGVNIFLVIILICLVSLLVYAVRKHMVRKRRDARQKEEDMEKQNAGIELLPKAVTTVPSEKQNGSPESAPLMNGEDEATRDVDGTADSESPANGGSRGDGGQARPQPPRDVLSVKVRAAEIPDSLPRTPILVDRRRTSDGQNIVVTPNLNQRISSGD